MHFHPCESSRVDPLLTSARVSRETLQRSNPAPNSSWESEFPSRIAPSNSMLPLKIHPRSTDIRVGASFAWTNSIGRSSWACSSNLRLHRQAPSKARQIRRSINYCLTTRTHRRHLLSSFPPRTAFVAWSPSARQCLSLFYPSKLPLTILRCSPVCSSATPLPLESPASELEDRRSSSIIDAATTINYVIGVVVVMLAIFQIDSITTGFNSSWDWRISESLHSLAFSHHLRYHNCSFTPSSSIVLHSFCASLLCKPYYFIQQQTLRRRSLQAKSSKLYFSQSSEEEQEEDSIANCATSWHY